ncbi:hypothetical protein D9M71_505570 [compost metagenome]
MKADRHVAFDECGSCVGPRHAGTDVEGLLAPQWREHQSAIRAGQPLAIGAVTHRTLFDVDLLAVIEVGLDRWIDLANTTSSHFVAGLGVVFHPLEVGDHGLHVS